MIQLSMDLMEGATSGSASSETSTTESASGTQKNMSELDPTEGKKSRDLEKGYLKGVLIAKRDGYSMATNSIGPLWVLEVNQPASKHHGEIFRCFEYLGSDIMIGNPDDGATDLWFQIQTLQRSDGTPLDVACNVTRHQPETV